MEEPSPERPITLMTWRSACLIIVHRALGRARWWPPGALVSWLALWLVMNSSHDAWTAFTLVHQIIGVMLPLILAAAVREEMRESRRTLRRRELTLAMNELGIDADALQPTIGESIDTIHDTSYASYIVLCAGLVCLSSICCAMGVINEAFLIPPFFILACLLTFFLLIERDGGTNIHAQFVRDAHLERVYRGVIEDRTQLAGGLVLDEHANNGASGGLSESVVAGGLEQSEEVALDFDTELGASEAHTPHTEQKQHH